MAREVCPCATSRAYAHDRCRSPTDRTRCDAAGRATDSPVIPPLGRRGLVTLLAYGATRGIRSSGRGENPVDCYRQVAMATATDPS